MTSTLNYTPAPLKVGNIEIQRVVEMQSLLFAAGDFLPTATSELLNKLKPQFETWAMCPQTGKLILAIQTYVLKPIESCAEQNTLMLTAHIPLPSIGKVTAADRGFGFTSVA